MAHAMTSAERPDFLAPDIALRAVTEMVIARQARSALAQCLPDHANSLRASLQCPTPILQKETRVTDVVRALRIREELKARVLQPLSNAPPSPLEPALLLWGQKSRFVRG